MNRNRTIKSVITELINKYQLTYYDIAEHLGVSYHAVYYWHKEKRLKKTRPHKYLTEALEWLLKSQT